MARLDSLLQTLVELGGSDLHVSAGVPPVFRVNGVLQRARSTPLDPGDAQDLIYEVLSEEQIEALEQTRDIDFGYGIEGLARFRGNAYFHRKGLGASFRWIPATPPTLDSLGMPPVVRELASLRRGLVVVTGPTGSGKSTTLASMIHHRNVERADHIITLEDPLEFLHDDAQCLIHQREVGSDARSFAAGLRAALREDPNVLLVGEMRDTDTVALALTGAETGLLVLGTLHTQSAAKTVDRIIDAFPADQQSQVRSMLAESLRGVIAQVLLRRADGRGRIAALEVLVNTPAVGHLIREAKTFQIPSLIQTGRKDGMQLLDQHLLELVNAKAVTPEEAARYAQNKAVFERLGTKTP
ncbi:MAG: type IV pilus twitching motility protein PilT [Deltaproteobacteria bacterium]|nr:type IV pilus twitching motility protein PilT [Deltaproteobacteria bacterium]